MTPTQPLESTWNEYARLVLDKLEENQQGINSLRDEVRQLELKMTQFAQAQRVNELETRLLLVEKCLENNSHDAGKRTAGAQFWVVIIVGLISNLLGGLVVYLLQLLTKK